jgi:hypothetical protein
MLFSRLLRLTGSLLLVVGFAAGCATVERPAPAYDDVLRFSANRPGLDLPRGWRPWIIARTKTPTQYDLVVDPATQKVVLHATADRAASGLKQLLDVDPASRPLIAWQWRVTALIDGADNSDRHADDSPVRLLLFFDGDRASLPAREQMLMETARMLTGQQVPYATLAYVWENTQPIGTVIPHAALGQLKMVVAGSGRDPRLGQWKRFERNYVEDYIRAFGQPPGKLIGVGILTDTDNTASRIESFYGDIELKQAPLEAATNIAN